MENAQIWKTQIDVTKNILEILIPSNYEVLDVIIIEGNPHLLYKCDVKSEKKIVKFKAYENGDEVYGKYIKSVIWKETLYHVFECESKISSER